MQWWLKKMAGQIQFRKYLKHMSNEKKNKNKNKHIRSIFFQVLCACVWCYVLPLILIFNFPKSVHGGSSWFSRWLSRWVRCSPLLWLSGGKMRETEWNGCIYLIVFVCIWFCIWMRFHWIWLNLYEFVCICLFSSSPTKGQKINTHSQDFINFHCNAHRCWGRGLLHSGLASSKSVTFPACQMHPNATMLGWWPGQVVVIKIWNYFEGCWMVLIEFQWFFWWTWWPLIFFIPLNSIPWAQKLSWPVQSQERQWSDDAPSLLLEHAAWQFVEGLGGVEGAHARKPHPYLQWELDEINSDELKRFNIIRKNKKTNTPWIFMNFPSTTKWSPIFRSEQRWIWTHHSKTALFPACTAGYCGRAELWVVVGWIWVELNWRNLNEHDWIWGIGVFPWRKFLICCDLLFFFEMFSCFSFFYIFWS